MRIEKELSPQAEKDFELILVTLRKLVFQSVLTHREVAEKAKCHLGHLSNVLWGKCSLSLPLLLRIADVFDYELVLRKRNNED